MENELHNLIKVLTGGNDQKAETAAGVILHIAQNKPDEVFNTICVLMDSKNPDERWWGVRLLAETSDNDETLTYMLTALRDEDIHVRQCAALGLRKNVHNAAASDLVDALNDEDHLVVELAADALTEIGEGAVPGLIKILEDGNPKARLEAVRALAGIGDQRSIPALFSLLDDDSQLIAYWANEGLERMGVGMVYYLP
jgi:HEAT repeat protein